MSGSTKGYKGGEKIPATERGNLSNGGKSRMLDVFILVSDPHSDKMVQRTFQVDANFADSMDTPQKAVREMNFLNRLARATWAAYYEMTAWLNEGKLPLELQQLAEANRAQAGKGYSKKYITSEGEPNMTGHCAKHPGTRFVAIKAGIHPVTKVQRWQKICRVCRSEAQRKYYEAKKAEKQDKVS